MTTPNITMLQSVQNFIGIIREQYPQDEDGSANLILILDIFKITLQRRASSTPATLEWLQTMKHAVRQAEIALDEIQTEYPDLMFGWYWGTPAANHAQDLANILCDLVLHVGLDIAANEALHPELKDALDHERKRYRQMKDEADAAYAED